MRRFVQVWCSVLLFTVFQLSAEVDVHGTTSAGWEFVRDLFRENLVQERDLGSSVAMYHHGKLVVDLWGGWFDESKTQPYTNDTLQLVFSTTKGLVAIAAALCVQRGLLDYSALVTTYWPEYGNHGKENTTVADILSHRAGLPLDTSPFQYYWNWTGMIQSLEQRQPIWPPGTQHGYHALTYGWLAGELIRRVDPKKRSLGHFILEEIANPLDIEFYIGLPSEKEYRVSPLNVKPNENGTINRTMYDDFNDPRTHQAEIPAANGITNARSLAKLYAALLGDVDDQKYRRIIDEGTLRQATKSNTPPGEIDMVLLFPTQLAMGFFLWDPLWPSMAPGIFGHSGLGGSIGFASIEKKFSFAYVVNRLDTETLTAIDLRYQAMIEEIAAMLDKNGTTLGKSFSLPLFFFSFVMVLVKLLCM